MRVEVTHAGSDKVDVLNIHKDRRRGLFNRDRFLVMDESFIAEKDYQTIRPGSGVDGPMLTQNPTRRQPAQETMSDHRGYVPRNLVSLYALGERLALSRHSFSVRFSATIKAMFIITMHSILMLLLLSTVVDFDIHIHLRSCSKSGDTQTLRLFTSTLAADQLNNQHRLFGAPIRFGHLAVAMADEHSPPSSVPVVPTYCSIAFHLGLSTQVHPDDVDDPSTAFAEDGQNSDFAAISDGAQVIDSLTSPSFHPRPPRFRPDIALWRWLSHRGDDTLTAEAALSPGTELGQCWAYAGASGQLGIQLSDRISISAVAIHHPLHDSSRQSAPRRLELWGLHTQAIELSADTYITDTAPVTSRFSPSPHLGAYGGLHILSGVYNATSDEQRQVFSLENTSYTGIAFESVVVQIVDNWGKDRYTCVYRIEIIGRQA